MSVEWFRDLAISILGFVALVASVLVAILAYSLYRRARSIRDSAKAISATIGELVSYAGAEAARPLLQFTAIIKGVRLGVDMVAELLRKRKGGSDV